MVSSFCGLLIKVTFLYLSQSLCCHRHFEHRKIPSLAIPTMPALRKPDPSTSGPPIHCSSQQTRFHAETLDTSSEIDLKDVTISIGEHEILEGAHLRLKSGVKYALVGRSVAFLPHSPRTSGV